MGRVFLEMMPGKHLFSCATCKANISNRAELITCRIRGAAGKAFLFHAVVNVVYGEIVDKKMLTGRYMIRYAFCKGCNSKLGWKYIYAADEYYRFREGLVVVEKRYCKETGGRVKQ